MQSRRSIHLADRIRFWRAFSFALIGAMTVISIILGARRACSQEAEISGHAEIVAADTIRILCDNNQKCPIDIRLSGYRAKVGTCWTSWQAFPMQDDTENGVRMQTRGEYRTSFDCNKYASDTIANIIAAKIVTCAPQGADKFGITIASCSARGDDGKDIDIAAEMIRRGAAVLIQR